MKWPFFGKRDRAEAVPQTVGVVERKSVAPNGKKILIVDDDPIIIKTTSIKLKSHGYEVLSALDASEAMSSIRQVRPDLILLDINFPPDVGVDWDGFKIIAWLQRFEEAKDTPIIVITGGDATLYEKRALASGAVGFFNKPIQHEKLLAKIGAILGTSEGPPQIVSL